MLHCALPPRKEAPANARPPGILTSSTLGSILRPSSLSSTRVEDDEPLGSAAIVSSPYGDWVDAAKPRPGKRPLRRAVNSPQQGQQHHQRKRRLKLEPMPCEPAQSVPGRNKSAMLDDRGQLPPSHHLDSLRVSLGERGANEQTAADKLSSDIRWIHSHFPVLQLASTKNSRRLRQQLLAETVQRVLTTTTTRASWHRWRVIVADMRNAELKRLAASRKVMDTLMAASVTWLKRAFALWSDAVAEARAQEQLAAAVTLQHFVRQLTRDRQLADAKRRAESLADVIRMMNVHAATIQQVYRSYRRLCRIRQCVESVVALQRVFRKQQIVKQHLKRAAACQVIVRSYRAYHLRRQRRIAAVTRKAFELAQHQQARRIQRAWRSYSTWKLYELPSICVALLVDQVEFLLAVRSIQANFCRFLQFTRSRAVDTSARKIQQCWKQHNRRVLARQERQELHLRRHLAACRLQRTFQRNLELREFRLALRKSSRPMYLRAREFDEPLRERFRVEIAKSAAYVLQSTWRKYRSYKTLQERRRRAACNIVSFLYQAKRRRVWLQLVAQVVSTHRQTRQSTKAKRKIQRWMLGLHNKQQQFVDHQKSAMQHLVETMAAAVSIQRQHRRRRDPWRRVLLRMVHHERPRSVQAARHIQQWWRQSQSRKRAAIQRKISLANVLEQRKRAQVQDQAARCIQRAYRRLLDRRSGRVLLNKHRVLMRHELKKRQQRSVIHSYLQDENSRRAKKSSASAATESTTATSSLPTAITPTVISGSAKEHDSMQLDAVEVSQEPKVEPIECWSEEYQRAYLFDPNTGVSSWL